jgi:pyridoxal phosphate enzyme (YggS family)
MEMVMEAYTAGQRLFGESRAQELRDKAAGHQGDINWHFIGHLQSNKIKYVAPVASIIHAVDSLILAQEINTFGEKKNLVIPVLIQVNTSEEATKYGITTEKAEEMFLEIYESMPRVQIKGLMCMAPFVEDEHIIRRSFSRLRLLKDSLEKKANKDAVEELSMGMSHDYEIAVEEGSTLVRVGTAIFGNRRRTS